MFFFKQKTAYEMRISDCSSDVCSSDLPNFRRLRYCRYADDFLVGVIGSKADAVRIMADIQHFLADRLNLAVSPEKTGVRDASKGSPFLGFHVCAFTLRSAGTMAGRQKVGGGTRRVLRRSTRGNI